MRVIYHGHEVMTYSGYLDLSTGGTLTCEPGLAYDITPEVMPNDGRFTPEEDEPREDDSPDTPEEPPAESEE